ncbi:hypothetical protein AB0C76_25955 [Kitasatospora sp. NPDC048722]|uniref:hypothetical protein n=1 Tax=Kitasatospora sp. NPDC048722 TaxID=3155639 RepID=UPI0033C2DA82
MTRMTGAGLLDAVDAVVLPCGAGCAEPDPRFHAEALRLPGARAEEALFIDDIPGHVEAARALGPAGLVRTGTAETPARIGEFVVGPGS